ERGRNDALVLRRPEAHGAVRRRGMSAELTFLFDDIEGSTRRWAAAASEMAAALAEHDSLVRVAVERAGGKVFKHTGDGAVAVFPGAQDAVAAAVAIQRQLSADVVRGDTIGA